MRVLIFLPLTLKDYDTEAGDFVWDNYLAKTGSTAVPPRAFKPRSPVGFKTGMKLECVDPRNPQLIRVATVAAVKVRNTCFYFRKKPLTYQTFIGIPIENSF